MIFIDFLKLFKIKGAFSSNHLVVNAAGSMASAAYIDSTVERDSEAYFPKDAYKACVRKHLGALSTNNEPLISVCPCGEAYERGENDSHALLCEVNSFDLQ